MAAVLKIQTWASALLLAVATFAAGALAQSEKSLALKSKSPERWHQRVERTSVPGRRVELAALKGATLYLPPKVNLDKPVPLVIHFHGAPWLVEQHIHEHLPQAALVTVQLGAGSSVYARPFADENLFSKVIDEAKEAAGVRRGWSSITLMAFSAGYGAVRSILRNRIDFDRTSGVLLLDGFHASYDPEGTSPTQVGNVSRRDIDVFLTFAREAVEGRKNFVITHSQIHPGSYASTTECTNELLREFGIRRQMVDTPGPMGMRQLSVAAAGKLRIFGYAGETAPDHIDHIHAMPHWFRFLGVR